MTTFEVVSELAKCAYESYGKTTDFKNFQGNPMPKWEELPEKIQRAWGNAVICVIENMKGGD